ncbi:MAG: AmmeMemoRadiSam system protein B [Patescibacteria group bacterium]
MPISKIFIDPQVFLSTDRLQPYNFKGKPIAGVVNHHILAADLIARFFKTLQAVRPDIETFIILSPDHFSQGRGISTHELAYVTPADDVAVNKSWPPELEKIGVWDGTESRAFENEHGVGALAPFIAREFPNAKILPIFLRADLTADKAQELGKALAKLADDKMFVIVSSDMSHYLKEPDARQHDVETIKWLQQNQWDRLMSATDKNTDSAVGLSILHAYLLKEGRGNFILLSHKISTDYMADIKNTTSYIVGFWE